MQKEVVVVLVTFVVQDGERNGVDTTKIPISETLGFVCSKSKGVSRAPIVLHPVREFVMCLLVRCYRFVSFFSLSCMYPFLFVK